METEKEDETIFMELICLFFMSDSDRLQPAG
jgi:hypothetical protein